jgi:glycyl-tRNA synthetase beta chain
VRAIADLIGQELGGPALAEQAERAALLAKADLLSDMVGEFPELQGVMGGYYVRHDGETEAVAQAIEDHYKPRFAGDVLPRNEVGLVVALADKLETLAGLFGIGQTPTGDKDPFALRRHALGVLRMLIERALPLDLPALVAMAQAPFTAVRGWSEVTGPVLQFFHERLAVLLREQGSSALEVDAVLGLKPARLDEVPRRLAAVRSFAGMPESASLAAANKRITNILKKSEVDGAGRVQPALFTEDAERSLHGALNDVAPRADALFEQRDYTGSLRELAALKAPVDAFFDRVMVNADDVKLRTNRLALLSALHRTMNRVADLSRLAA